MHTGRFFEKMIAASFGHYIPQLGAIAPVFYQAMPKTLLANTATLLQAKLSTRVSLASPTARSHILCWFHRRTVKGRRGGARWLTGHPTGGRAAPSGGGWGEVSPPQASSSDALAAARRCCRLRLPTFPYFSTPSFRSRGAPAGLLVKCGLYTGADMVL